MSKLGQEIIEGLTELRDHLETGEPLEDKFPVRIVQKPNRLLARRARLGKGWCGRCDRAQVGDGAKCPVCGQRSGRKRDKKALGGDPPWRWGGE